MAQINKDLIISDSNVTLDKLVGLGRTYIYTLTGLQKGSSDSYSLKSWVPLAENYETGVLPIGKYLVLFIGQVYGSGNGMTTLNPYLDGSRMNNYNRQTIPIGTDLQTTGICSAIVEFTEAKTHIVNIYHYTNVACRLGAAAVKFIRII